MNKQSIYRPFLNEIELKIARHELTIRQLYQFMLEKFDLIEMREKRDCRVKDLTSAIKIIKEAGTPRHAKAACIGEHKFILEGMNVCPECSIEYDEECDVCGGECDESGRSDLTVVVPWDTSKDIYKDMSKVLIEQLEREVESLKDDGNV
jgi:hypothetical protein